MRLPGLCVLALFVAVVGSRAAEQKPVAEVGLANYEATQKATADLKRKLENYRKSYCSKLKTARTYAVRDADAQEVQRIDDALSGKYVGDYTSKSAMSAREYFDGRLRYLVKDYCGDLERVVKSLLAKGQNEDAIFIQDTITFLQPYIEEEKKTESSGGHGRKKISVRADKDWQETGVTLKPGSVVSLSVSGRWAPGYRGKKKTDLGDADTYPLQIRVGGQVRQGGTKWDSFKVDGEGEMLARMQPLRTGLRSEARGSVTMSLQWDEPVENAAGGSTSIAASKSLETVLTEIVDPKLSSSVTGAKKQGDTAAGKVYTFYLKSDQDWQDTGVTIKLGQKVSIVADGEWTPNKDRRPKQSADRYRYAVRVKNSTQAIGGKQTSFTASANGEINVRATFYPKAKELGRPTDGSLKLTITVSPK